MAKPIQAMLAFFAFVGGGLAIASCASHSDYDNQNEIGDNYAVMAERHGDSSAARRAAEAMAKLDKRYARRPNERPELDFVPLELHAVYVAESFEQSDGKMQVGWIQTLTNDEGLTYSRYLNRQWRPLAYTSLDGELHLLANPAEDFGGRRFGRESAARQIFPPPTYKGMDYEKYERITFLRESQQSSTLGPEERGIELTVREGYLELVDMTNKVIADEVVKLEKKRYYRAEAEKQENIRLERIGGRLTEWDDRKILPDDDDE